MESLIMTRSNQNERQPAKPSDEDSREAVRKLEIVREAQRDTEVFKAPELLNGPNPADIFNFEATQPIDISALPTHVDLDVENSPAQAVEVHVSDTPVETPLAPEPYVDHFAAGLNKQPSTLAEETATEAEAIALEVAAIENKFEEATFEAPVQSVEATPVEAPVETTPVVLAEEAPKNETITPKEADKEEVATEATSKLNRKDFVKQQEDLFGANDEVKAEDVPEGELTYEQYLAQRPTAETGDYYHHNDRVYSAVPTGPIKEKKAKYEAQFDSSAAGEHYDNILNAANQNEVIDDALQENETKDEAYDRIIRTNVEGEFLVEKDPRLQGLLGIGKELLALYNSELTGDEFEKQIRPELEAKKAIYDDLYDLYESKGLDHRALWHIEDQTHARVEDPDFIPVEGSPYVNGEKVTILDFVETPDGKKAYTIEKADGSIEAIYTDQVSFKREFEKVELPEAAEEVQPEATEVSEVTVPAQPETQAASEAQVGVEAEREGAEEPEVEPEKQLSRFERAKKLFSKEERDKRREFGGVAYWTEQWTNPSSLLRTRKINENMSEEAAQAQRIRNRQNIMFGLTALTLASAAARTFGLGDVLSDSISDALGSMSFDGLENAPQNGPGHFAVPETGYDDGSNADFVPGVPPAAENANEVPTLPGAGESFDTAPVDGPAPAPVDADAFVPGLPPAAENANEVPTLPGAGESFSAAPQPEIGHADGGAGFGGADLDATPDAPVEGLQALNISVDHPAYDIPKGGGGIQLFESLGLSEDKWNEHAQELADLFPDSFEYEGTDVRIKQPGLLALNVREKIGTY